MQLFNCLFLVAADLLDEIDRRIMDTLLRRSDQLLASTERFHLRVERGDLRLTAVTFLDILSQSSSSYYLSLFRAIGATCPAQ